MKKLLPVLFLLLAANCFGQNRNSVWCFGDSAGIDFSNLSNPVPFASGMDGRGSCSSISDSTGSLLFYAFNRAGNADSAVEVYNRNHVLMQNGSSIIATGLYNELLIIPNPGTTEKYFLFSIGIPSPVNQGLFCSKIDMSLNAGLGVVVQKNIRINNFRNGDCLSAIKHGNGRDWWVLSKYSDINATTYNRTYVYLITEDSVHSPIIQDFNNSIDCDVQRIIFNTEGTKFMQINVYGFMCEFDFDRCTGIISNPNVIFPEQTSIFTRLFWHGTYSPNKSKFYISTFQYNSDTTRIVQFDLNAPVISNSADTLFEVKYNIQTGALRLAPDNKIYVSTCYFAPIPNGYPYPDSIRFQSNENLSVINFPDSSGSACNFQPYSFYLGGKRAYWGLPNNPNYEMPALAGSPCDTITSIPYVQPTIATAQLMLTCIHSWQTLFVNAQNLKSKNCLLQLYDVSGKLVYTTTQKTVNGYFTCNVPLQAMAKGVYVVKLVGDVEVLGKRFVRE